MAVVIAIVAGILAAFGLFRLFFRDHDDFSECLAYSFTPDLFSLFRGKLAEDWASSMRLSLYIAMSFGAGVLMYQLINWLLPS